MKIVPTSASGPARAWPLLTVLTSSPMATANAAGKTPRIRIAAHQAAARPGLAFGRTPKNFHSFRSVIAKGTPVPPLPSIAILAQSGSELAYPGVLHELNMVASSRHLDRSASGMQHCRKVLHQLGAKSLQTETLRASAAQ